MALVVGGSLLAYDRGDTTATTTSTTERRTTTTEPGSSTSTTSAPSFEAAVFPDASGTRRFDDAVTAARAFAVDYVLFVDPVVGRYCGGDARSGEVDVRPRADGPLTTVLVRMIGDTWWVVGAATPNIVVAQPTTLATITSPGGAGPLGLTPRRSVLVTCSLGIRGCT